MWTTAGEELHSEFFPQSLGLALTAVSTLKWLYVLMRGAWECASNPCFRPLFKAMRTWIDRLEMGPQSLLKCYAFVAFLSWGSFLVTLYLTKHNRKSNLAWFSLFQLWFLLWLLSISYNLCSFSCLPCFWINPCCLQCAMTRGASRLFLTLLFAAVLWCIDR